MPFTLSHPAAVVPLRRLLPWSVLSALAIGSMAPDFPYFVGFSEIRWHTHSFASIAWFSVPAGLAAYLVFQRWLRAAWIDLLPAAFAARVPQLRERTPLLAVIASLALGAATHVVWDSFTHEHQPGVMLVRALNVVLVQVLGFPVRGYNVLQHGSTLVGAGLLALWIRGWLRTTPRGELPATWLRAAAPRRWAPYFACGVIAPSALLHATRLYPPGGTLESLRSFVGAATVSAMSLGFGALFVYAAWSGLSRRQLARETTRERAHLNPTE